MRGLIHQEEESKPKDMVTEAKKWRELTRLSQLKKCSLRTTMGILEVSLRRTSMAREMGDVGSAHGKLSHPHSHTSLPDEKAMKNLK